MARLNVLFLSCIFCNNWLEVNSCWIETASQQVKNAVWEMCPTTFPQSTQEDIWAKEIAAILKSKDISDWDAFLTSTIGSIKNVHLWYFQIPLEPTGSSERETKLKEIRTHVRERIIGLNTLQNLVGVGTSNVEKSNAAEKKKTTIFDTLSFHKIPDVTNFLLVLVTTETLTNKKTRKELRQLQHEFKQNGINFMNEELQNTINLQTEEIADQCSTSMAFGNAEPEQKYLQAGTRILFTCRVASAEEADSKIKNFLKNQGYINTLQQVKDQLKSISVAQHQNLAFTANKFEYVSEYTAVCVYTVDVTFPIKNPDDKTTLLKTLASIIGYPEWTHTGALAEEMVELRVEGMGQRYLNLAYEAVEKGKSGLVIEDFMMSAITLIIPVWDEAIDFATVLDPLKDEIKDNSMIRAQQLMTGRIVRTVSEISRSTKTVDLLARENKLEIKPAQIDGDRDALLENKQEPITNNPTFQEFYGRCYFKSFGGDIAAIEVTWELLTIATTEESVHKKLCQGLQKEETGTPKQQNRKRADAVVQTTAVKPTVIIPTQ